MGTSERAPSPVVEGVETTYRAAKAARDALAAGNLSPHHIRDVVEASEKLEKATGMGENIVLEPILEMTSLEAAEFIAREARFVGEGSKLYTDIVVSDRSDVHIAMTGGMPGHIILVQRFSDLSDAHQNRLGRLQVSRVRVSLDKPPWGMLLDDQGRRHRLKSK